MMKALLRCICMVLMLAPAFSLQSNVQSLYGRYSGPRSLGPYSLDRDVSLRTILSTFGVKPSRRDTYCFADKERKLYLYVQPKHESPKLVADVLLSSFPNCKDLPIASASIDPSVWKTPEGIGIGSSKEEVIRAYHSPLFIRKLSAKNDVGVIAGIHDPGASKTQVGDSSFLYSCLISPKESCSDDLRVARLGFAGDTVVWIHVSNSE